MILVALLAIAGASPRVEPTVGATSKVLFRQIVVDVDGARQRSYGVMHEPFGVKLGAQLYYRHDRRDTSFDTGGLRGTFELGAAALFPTGGAALSISHSTLHEWKTRPRVSFVLGAMVGLHLDVPRVKYSFAEIGMPLGLSTRRADVLWVPSVSLPLQVRTRDVYRGELRQSVAPMFMPLNVMVRFKLGRSKPNARRRGARM